MTQPRTIDDVLRVVAAHPLADRRVDSLHDPIGAVAEEVVRLHPEPETIAPEHVDKLMIRLERTADHTDTDNSITSKSFAFGSLFANVYWTSVKLSSSKPVAPVTSIVAEFSARIPGLHQEMPVDRTAGDRALRAVRSILQAHGHPRDQIASIRIVQRDNLPRRSVMLALPAAEDPTESDTHTEPFGHQSDRETDRLAAKIASHIMRRWRRRDELRAAIEVIEHEVRGMIRDVPEMELVKVAVASYSNPGRTEACEYVVRLRMLGHNLRIEDVSAHWSERDASRFQMRRRIREHRKRLVTRGKNRQATERSDGGDLVIAPILAAAIADVDPRYARGVLDEIESAIAGRGLRPSDARKRGISNISLREGRVNACVDLSPEVRYEKDRLTLKTVNGAPDTLLNGIRGIDMRHLVDHPYLEGLTAASATISRRSQMVTRKNGTRGVESVPCMRIRTEQHSVPIGPALKKLRAIAASHQPATKAPAKRRTKPAS